MTMAIDWTLVVALIALLLSIFNAVMWYRAR